MPLDKRYFAQIRGGHCDESYDGGSSPHQRVPGLLSRVASYKI